MDDRALAYPVGLEPDPAGLPVEAHPLALAVAVPACPVDVAVHDDHAAVVGVELLLLPEDARASAVGREREHHGAFAVATCREDLAVVVDGAHRVRPALALVGLLPEDRAVRGRDADDVLLGHRDDEVAPAVLDMDRRAVGGLVAEAPRLPDGPAGLLVERDHRRVRATGRADDLVLDHERRLGDPPRDLLAVELLLGVDRPDRAAVARVQTRDPAEAAHDVDPVAVDGRRGAGARETLRPRRSVGGLPLQAPGHVEREDVLLPVDEARRVDRAPGDRRRREALADVCVRGPEELRALRRP